MTCLGCDRKFCRCPQEDWVRSVAPGGARSTCLGQFGVSFDPVNGLATQGYGVLPPEELMWLIQPWLLEKLTR